MRDARATMVVIALLLVATLTPYGRSVRADTLVVNSTADSGVGTLRWALQTASAGDTVTFDTAVFAPGSPQTITLSSGLPDLTVGNLTVDASDAGVILDGSGIGTTPEVMLLDDVSLTLGGGPNLIANGDFAAGTGHWRPFDERPGATRDVYAGDFRSSPQSYQWSATAHAGILRTVYDTDDTSAPLSEWPLGSDSTAWIPATGDTTAELRFWYRGSTTTGRLLARFSDGHQESVDDWWCPAAADWTECTLSKTLPSGVTGVAVAFELNHTDRWTAGLAIRSSDNVIRGLQIVHLPGNGVDVRGQNNVIGGDRSLGAGPMGQGNLISGGGGYGLFVGGSGTSTSYNTIAGNYVGTDISGASPFGNAWAGISLQNGAHHNTVGGDAPGEGNLVSDSGADGIWLTGSGVDHNTISGNRVGTDASGTAAIPNGGFGVIIRSGAKYNVVGGDTAGERNLISGNGNCGLVIMDPGTDHNVVSGNYIGTDASGTTAIPNPQCGVGLWGGPQHSSVGGTAPGERNLISGNAAAGIWISDSDNNVVIGNYIGTDASGTAELGNGPPGPGVFILDGARLNTIGGTAPGERNLISGNHGDGVSITGSDTVSNTVLGNDIGTGAGGTSALHNAGNGVSIRHGASWNTVGVSNTIAFNAGAGVLVEGSDTLWNTISRNSIYSNTLQGIDLRSSGNGGLPAPTITSHDLASGVASGRACVSCTVQVFSDAADQGKQFEDSAVADTGGHWALNLGTAFAGPKLTATATDLGGNTSEFGGTGPRFEVYLPLALLLSRPLSRPAAPALYDIANPGHTSSYTVSWSAVSGASSYTLEEDDNSAFSSPTAVYDGSNTSTAIAGQAQGTYYYRVRASNAAGSSEWSAVKSVVVVVPPSELFDSVLRLDGQDDYAAAADSADLAVGDGADESLTLEAWFNITTLNPSSERYNVVACKWESYCLAIHQRPSQTTNVQFRVWRQTPGSINLLVGVGYLTSGWHHVAAVFDNAADELRVYYDGERKTTSTIISTDNLQDSSYGLEIGGGNGGDCLGGAIEEVRLSDVARYAGDTYALPGSPFTCDGQARALWHFDEPAGSTTLHDGSGCGGVADTLSGLNGAASGP